MCLQPGVVPKIEQLNKTPWRCRQCVPKDTGECNVMCYIQWVC